MCGATWLADRRHAARHSKVWLVLTGGVVEDGPLQRKDPLWGSPMVSQGSIALTSQVQQPMGHHARGITDAWREGAAEGEPMFGTKVRVGCHA